MIEAEARKHKKVMAPCKRGSDILTKGQACSSKQAYLISPQGSTAPAFKCCKCGHEWVTPTGGTFHGV
jgi:ribosomal protein S27E